MRSAIWGFIILVMGLCTVDAYADSLYLGQWSHHFKKSQEIKREKHPLVLYEYDDTGVLFGYWKNSYNRNTFAIGKSFVNVETKYGKFGAKGGLASGYDIPVFGALYYEVGWVAINWVPTEVISIGLKFDLP